MNSLFCLSQHHNKYVLHCQNQFGPILQNIHSTMLMHDRFIFEKFLYLCRWVYFPCRFGLRFSVYLVPETCVNSVWTYKSNCEQQQQLFIWFGLFKCDILYGASFDRCAHVLSCHRLYSQLLMRATPSYTAFLFRICAYVYKTYTWNGNTPKRMNNQSEREGRR